MYVKRLSGQPGPWTSDPILGQHRFTNCFRAADPVLTDASVEDVGVMVGEDVVGV